MKDLLRHRSSAAATHSRGWAAGLVLAGALVQPVLAQPKKPRGTIEAAEIEIVKERVNQLPEATRNFDKIQLEAPAKPDGKVTYTYPDFRLPADRLNPSVRVLTIRAEEAAPLTGKFLKAGLGNYGTFYGRAYWHDHRTTDYAYGVDVKHVNSLNGPVDGKNSGVSQTSASLMGELYRGTTAFGARLDGGHERYNFYGYERGDNRPTPEKDQIKQSFNRLAARAYARNRDPQQTFQYEGGLGFRYWSDDFTAKESNFTVDGKAGYALNATSRITLALDASFISDQDSAFDRNRNFVQATPAYEHAGERLSVMLGATLGYSSDTLNDVSKTVIYPAVRLGYTVVPEKFVVYAGSGGALQRVTKYDLSTENPWLNRNLNVADTHRGPTGYLGFSATPVRALELNARATYARDKNLYFYLNDSLNQAKFNLVYDTETTSLLNIHGEALYAATEKFRLGGRADYNRYGVKSLAQPFHRPEFQASVFGTYTVLADKLQLGTELYFYSASYGISYVREGGLPVADFYRATDAIYDLNLRADYRITPKISIFAMGNNLANRQYQRFYRYPVKGINALGGATFTF